LPLEMLDHLKKVWVAGQQLNIVAEGESATAAASAPASKPVRKEKTASTENKASSAQLERVETAPTAVAASKKVRADNDAPDTREAETKKRSASKKPGAVEMEAFRIEVGHAHGI